MPWLRALKLVRRRMAREYWQNRAIRRALLIGLFALAAAATIVSGAFPDTVSFRPGQVATRDIMSPRTVENRPLTQALREEAARQAELDAIADPDNYDLDVGQARRAGEVIQALFARLEAAASQDAGGGDGAGSDAQGAREDPTRAEKSTGVGADRVEAVWAQIRDELRIDLGRTAVENALAIGPERLKTLADATLDLVVPLMQQERISNSNLQQMRELAYMRAENLPLPRSERAIVGAVARAVIRPNLVLNREKVEAARAEAMAQVQPLLIQEGQVIVRRGDVIKPEHITILQDLGLLRGSAPYWALLGTALFVAAVVASSFIFVRRYAPRMWGSDRQLALWGVLILLPVVMTRLFTLIPWQGAGFLVPLPLGAIGALLLLDMHLALVAALVDAVLVTGVVGWDSPLPVLTLVGSFAWIGLLPRGSQRADITRIGLLVGGFSALIMSGLALLFRTPLALHWAALGLFNGVSTAIFTLGILPYVETAFHLMSSIRLLELSHPTQPLLRRLMLEAPGTYHHSIMVGNLAEAAAEAIGADSLLVRVGAQYHDIGKIKRPYFFIENQFGGDNPHDRLNPRLSALIVRAHVKDGVALARQYRLPHQLVAFIQEHHGTTLIPYFYHKAAVAEGVEAVSEEDFRYAGPRPQTKETAIVMLADAVEATVRSQPQINRARLEQTVRKLVRDRLDDGQLDESGLTLKDLEGIIQAFLRILNGMFHNRIQYPSATEQDRAMSTAGHLAQGGDHRRRSLGAVVPVPAGPTATGRGGRREEGSRSVREAGV
ncbi:MAG: HDIG domain-containing protein [Limnochordales bacterium]|nr:HDIG domain-containing protein [Limnochordales bacterium]